MAEVNIKLVKSLIGSKEGPDRYCSCHSVSRRSATQQLSLTMLRLRVRSIKLSHLIEVTEA